MQFVGNMQCCPTFLIHEQHKLLETFQDTLGNMLLETCFQQHECYLVYGGPNTQISTTIDRVLGRLSDGLTEKAAASSVKSME